MALRPRTPNNKDYTLKGSTLSLCPVCKKQISAKIVEKDNKVYFKKVCPEHGPSMVLVSSDAQWTESIRRFYRPAAHFVKGAKPKKPIEKGCPNDCGLCEDHEQHSIFAAIEVTDHCDMTCPVCFVAPENSWHLPPEKAEWMLDRAIESEGDAPESLILTGGEPGLHPQIFEIIDMALAKGVNFVALNTNGTRLARDLDFAKRLGDYGEKIIVNLSYDGLDDEVYMVLRGRKLLAIKDKALENLGKYNCQTMLTPTIYKGLNENQIGDLIRVGIAHNWVKVVYFQPALFNKRYDQENKAWVDWITEDHNFMERITQPDIFALAEKQTKGLLSKADFLPQPCQHPACIQMAYIVRLEKGGAISLGNVLPIESYFDCLENRARIDIDMLEKRIEEDEKNGVIPNCDMLNLSEETVMQVYVHSLMDPYTYDVNRVKKCGLHQIMPDGNMMPCCNYDIVHRPKFRHLYDEFRQKAKINKPDLKN